MIVLRVNHKTRPLIPVLAGLVVGATLAVSGVALAGVADSPPTPTPTDTSTSNPPVSTVTVLPSPAPAPVPKPDPSPAKAVVPRPDAQSPSTPPPHTAVAAHSSLPASAPVRGRTSTRAAVASKRLRVRKTHAAVHNLRHNAVPVHRRPVGTPPKHTTKPTTTRPGAGASAPVATTGGGSPWIGRSAIVAMALLLLAAGLAATVRELRKRPAVVGDALVLPPAPPSVPPNVEPASTVTMPGAAVLVPPPVGELPPEEERASPHDSPADAVAAGSCRITWWRGYVRSRFVAQTWNETSGLWTLIAESPSFSWRSSDPPPETSFAVAAYRELAETLDNLGWTLDGNGDEWFDARFRHAVEGALPSEPLSRLLTPTR